MRAECGPQGAACAKGLLFPVTGLGRIRLIDCLVDTSVISEMWTRSGSLGETFCGLVFEVGGGDTEPCWITDGSALRSHGFHPCLHPLYPPPRPWRSTPWLVDDHLTLLPAMRLGRNKQLSLCSLEGYPLGVGCFLTSSEPISDFGSGLSFV
jgi:hypothetical protein